MNENKYDLVGIIKGCFWFLMLVSVMRLAKHPVVAFWSDQTTGSVVRFTTGDWTAPAVSVLLSQSDQAYHVVDVVDAGCAIKQSTSADEVELDDSSISCQLNLDQNQKPQFLTFWYKQSLEHNLPLINQPSFKVDLVVGDQRQTVFVPGISLDQTSFGWHQVWLNLADLVELMGGWDGFSQNSPQLQFELLTPALDHQSSFQPQVKLKGLTSQVVVAQPTDKLVLQADEPVSWQVRLFAADSEEVINLDGQTAELSLDQVADEANTISWQIQATDPAQNQSPVIDFTTQFYQSTNLVLDDWQVKSELDNRLSFQFALPALPLGQIRNLRLMVNSGDGQQSVKLIKTVPFTSLATLLTQSSETVVVTSQEPVLATDYCLEAQMLNGQWQTLKCHSS